MKIILSAAAALPNEQPDGSPLISGETITYRGQSYDLTQLNEGSIVKADSPFEGSITRINGQIQLKLQYKYNSSLAEPNQSTNWEDYTFIVTEGQCPDPIKYKPVIEEPSEVIEV